MTIHEFKPRGSAPPTPPPRDTAELLNEVQASLARFVVLPNDEASITASLYVLHTWAVDGAHATPYLVVESPEPRSGKTKFLEALKLLVREPWHVASYSESALFRKIENQQPTLLLDEVDATFGSNNERTEPLRAVLNAGNRRGATATRVVGKGAKLEVQDFSVFCPKVLAGINTGRLPETIKDRAVVIAMKRRTPDEPVERLRFRFAEVEVQPLRDSLGAWAATAADGLHEAVPELPLELDDRAGDSWEPLLAIADLAGGDWPKQARAAAVALSSSVEEESGLKVQLLQAIHNALIGRDVIASEELVAAINENEDLPFGGWKDGKGIDKRKLAALLRPFKVKSKNVRVGDRTPKGYRRDDFEDAFSRYLPGAPQAPQAPQGDSVAPEKAHKTGDVADVADVAPVAGISPAGADVAHTEGYADRFRRDQAEGRWGR